MRVGLLGLGAVGVRAARHLLAHPGVEQLVVCDRDRARAQRRTQGWDSRRTVVGERSDRAWRELDAVVLAVAEGSVPAAADALAAGAHVVAAVDDPWHVRHLLGLDRTARAAGRTLAVGATMAPGLSCVLARYAAARLDTVEEVHVASFGTGGPSCARRHHAALAGWCTDWYDGGWRHRPGGSGRQLLWFPEPVGPADCYRARLVDPVLVAPAFPGVVRVTARIAATRRDRMTGALPMLRPPHPEGTLGAARVEVRGRRDGRVEPLVLGGAGRPAVVAGTVAAVTATWAATGQLDHPGAAGLADLVGRPGAFLAEVQALGVTLSVFEGLSPAEAAAAT